MRRRPLPALSRTALAGLLGLLSATAAAPALAEGGPATPPPPPDPAARAAHIAELVSAIRRDQERVVAIITDTANADKDAAYENPELREIAARLPDLQREIGRLDAVDTLLDEPLALP